MARRGRGAAEAAGADDGTLEQEEAEGAEVTKEGPISVSLVCLCSSRTTLAGSRRRATTPFLAQAGVLFQTGGCQVHAVLSIVQQEVPCPGML